MAGKLRGNKSKFSRLLCSIIVDEKYPNAKVLSQLLGIRL